MARKSRSDSMRPSYEAVTSNDQTWIQDPRLLDATGRRIERDHTALHSEVKAYLRLYYSRVVSEKTIDLDAPYREQQFYEALRELSGNLTREIVDAALALICRPLKPEVVPVGADHELQQGCEQAEMLIEGVFDNCNFTKIATGCARDGATAHVGAIKGLLHYATNEIRFERINPLEVFWPDDGTDSPRVMMHITAMPRDGLIARYPEHADAIRALPSFRRRSIVGVSPFNRPSDSDTVRYTEAWATQLSDGQPGRHCAVIGDIVLEDEPWPYDIHPICVFRWQPDFEGFAGVSLARIVGPYDANNRRLAKRVYQGLAGAVPWVKTRGNEDDVDLPSDVAYQHIHVAEGSSVEIEMPRQTVSPEIIAEMQRNRERAFSESGVNQQAAQGAAPASLSSGKAQETWIDIVNTRLQPAQHEWQSLWQQAGKVVVMLAQHAKKAHVRIDGTNYYKTVEWPDIGKDKFKVRFALSSGLGLTVAARFQNLQRLLDAQAIDMPDFLRGLDIPDTKRLSDRINAKRDLVLQMISRALKHGIFTMPSALQGEDGLQSLIKLGSEELQLAWIQQSAPKKNIEVLRRLILAAKSRLEPPPQAPPEETAGAPQDPNATPPVDPNGAPVDPQAQPGDPTAALPPDAMPANDAPAEEAPPVAIPELPAA